MSDESSPTFRPRARLLQMLGNELIGTPRLAVFELVKNAYDADASEVKITFSKPGTDQACILVRDNGEGMDRATIVNVWLEPGADYRQKQRSERKRTEKYKRLPLGEKGVGRFAVHKLGNEIELRTRRAGHPEYRVFIDWSEYSKSRYMDEATVIVEESSKSLFTEDETGTQVMVSELHDKWTKGDVRRLWRNVKSISSPTKSPDSFSVKLLVPQHNDWLDGLLDVPDFLDRAMWRFTFTFEDGKFEWEYNFRPMPGIKVEPRNAASPDSSALKLAPQDQKRFAAKDGRGRLVPKIVADTDFTKVLVGGQSIEQVGPVIGQFFAFDRDRPVLDIMPEAKSLTEFLDENGGVRVYRDGVRVHNYGERATGDDWLGLDQRRVNIPTRRFSNNILIGSIDISLAQGEDTATGLIEKTNREGFVENSAFEKFRAIVLAALIEFENQRQGDKDRVRRALKPMTARLVGDLENPIGVLREEFAKRDLSEALGRHLTAIERKFNQMKEVMTHAGNAGLNLGILFHEIDRGVRGLTADIRHKLPQEDLLKRAENLSQLLDGFSTLLRKDTKKDFRISALLKESKILNENRFTTHDVVVSCPLLSGEQSDFTVNASFGMLLGALSNLIDNSIYWLQVRWPDSETGTRAIYIGTSEYYEEGPAIIIADNGPGLPSDISTLTQPFVTMKPDGMGLGLYYVNLVCELNNAKLIISPDPDDVDIPRAYNGAAFAIVFMQGKI